MKKTALLVLFTFIAKCFIAQNLVTNGDFEVMNYCPNNYGEVFACHGWLSAPNDTVAPYATEYMNACNTGLFNVPNGTWGYQIAHSGTGYMALATMAPQFTVNYRENIYTQLTTPLVVGTTYSVSMYVSHTDNSQHASNNLGLKFSTVPSFPINNIAHVNSSSIITDNTNWVLISGNFVADSAYTYIAVGNFFTDANTATTTSCGSCSFNQYGYFIDDVSVIAPIAPSCSIAVTGSGTICSGGTATLTANGANVYVWNTGAITANIVVSPSVTTTYTVTGVTGTCTSQTVATINVISVSPTVSVSGNSSICAGSTTTLTATGANSYTWSTGTTTASVVLSPTVTTTYTVVGSACSNTAQAVATINVNPINPTVTINGSGTICPGNSATLTAIGASSYTWSTGETTASIITNPIVTTTYTVTAGIGACSTQAVSTVALSSLFNFTMPNIITPNNDDINDFIDFGKYQFSSMQLEIYNRWGIKILESNNPAYIWKPTNIDDGTYFYVIQYQIDCDGNTQGKTLKGFITSIK